MRAEPLDDTRRVPVVRPGYAPVMSEHTYDGIPIEPAPKRPHDDEQDGFGSISGGAGEGVSGTAPIVEPGEGPTSDEATGITGDPEDG